MQSPKSTDIITLRPALENDIALLRALYATTRADELAMVPWSAEEKSGFVDFQFYAQHNGYRSTYPDAEYSVVELNGDAIGRIYIDRSPERILLIEITLLPEMRRQGIGSRLITNLLNEAQDSDRPVHLHVEEFNPAMRLYSRLGFVIVTPDPFYTLMEWRPTVG